MELYWKVFMLCGIFIQILITTYAATTTIDLFNSQTLNKDNVLSSLKNAENSFQQVKTYTTKTTRCLDDFNTHPQIKSSHSSSFTSYVPPPSGLVSYKNIQLPLANSVKLPILLPNAIQPIDYTKHPGFVVMPSSAEIDIEDPEPMFMIEEPASVLLQPQNNKTIEAAKILASSLLEAGGEAPLEAGQSLTNNPSKSTNVYIVKSQKKAYIIPTHLKKEATKASAVDELYPMRDQFEKAYTINQFIFVIKPEKINFLNKLV